MLNPSESWHDNPIIFDAADFLDLEKRVTKLQGIIADHGNKGELSKYICDSQTKLDKWLAENVTDDPSLRDEVEDMVFDDLVAGQSMVVAFLSLRLLGVRQKFLNICLLGLINQCETTNAALIAELMSIQVTNSEQVGPDNLNEAMAHAARMGCKDIVEMLLERGACSYNCTMAWAARNGRLDIVEMMIERGATDYNWTMRVAAKEGYVSIVKRMLEKGANNYNDALLSGVRGGHQCPVEMMLALGVTVHCEAEIIAREKGHDYLVYLIRSNKLEQFSSKESPGSV